MADKEVVLKLKGLGDFSDIQNKVKNLQKEFKGLTLPTGKKAKFNELFGNLDSELKNFHKRLEDGFKTKGDITGLEKNGKEIIRLFSQIEAQIENTDFSKAFSTPEIEEVAKKISVVKKEITDLNSKIKKVKETGIKIDINQGEGKESITEIDKALEQLESKYTKKDKVIELKKLIDTGDVDAAREKIAELQKGLYRFKDDNKKEIAPILSGLDQGLENYQNELQDLTVKSEQAQESIKGLVTEREKLAEPLKNNIAKDVQEASEATRDFVIDSKNAAEAEKDLNNELESLGQRAKYFFSIAGAARLARQAIRQLWQETQELDKAMTETAVVTDFSVGDMWEKLPQYTKNAKELGVATKSLYEATTLYYQQGLKGNEVMNIGVETLKLARIAGLEAANATDLMTTALRGFNMEINEESAQRVSDTYAALAASSASNVQELATAMSKTASIAASVGAEFENIAVFLAQGIETTRESADNIGTAMKTVLARFNEMKKDPAEIMDVEGEAVDVNKVETALRSAGIALRDTNGQFREADKVLLEVAEKWDSLSLMQQRYIATQAAGSRQQSRFIAMMSDYNRTLELQNVALNSAGASQKQYEKTQESLETKVARLKDTWQEFILGLANDKAIKGVVDLLGGLLNIVNKLTNLPGLFGSIAKGFLALGIFKSGKVLTNSLSTAYAAAKEMSKTAGGDVAGEFLRSFKDSLGKNSKSIFKGFSFLNRQEDLVKNVAQLDKLEHSYTLVAKAEKEIKKTTVDHVAAAHSLSLKNTALNNSNKILIDSLSTINSVYGIGTDKIKDYGAFMALGTTADQAAAMVKMGLTEEQFNEIITTKKLELGTEQLTDATWKQILADEGLTNAERELENAQRQRMISGSGQGGFKLTEMLNNFASKDMSIEKVATEIKGKLGDAVKGLGTKLKGTGKAALGLKKALGGAIVAHPFIAAAAAAAILTVGIAVIYKKYFSLEARIKKAEEETERARSSAQKTKEAYDNLLENKNRYNELQKTLENAVKGTDEWTQALLNVNQQVLELLKNYPKLANYIKTGDNGELSITSEGWKTIIKEQQNYVKNAQEAVLFAGNREVELKQQKARKDFNSELAKRGFFYSDVQDDIFNYFQNNDLIAAQEKIIRQFLISENVVQQITDDYIEYQKTINSLNTESKVYKNQFEKELQEQLSSIGGIDKASQGLASVFTNTVMTNEEVEKRQLELRQGMWKDAGVAKTLTELGYGSKVKSSQKQNMVTLYGILSGKTQEEILDEFNVDKVWKISNRDIARGIAQLELGGKAADLLTNFYKKYFIKLNKENQKTLSNVLSDEGKNLDLFDLKNLDAIKLEEKLKEYAQEMGVTQEQFYKSLNFESWKELIDAVGENIRKANEAYEKTTERLGVFGVSSKLEEQDFAKNLSSGQFSELGNKLYDVIVKSGTNGYEKVVSELNDIWAKIPVSLRDNFIDEINKLDWTDTRALKGFNNSLKELGISLPDKQIEHFVNTLKESAKAINKLSLQEINSKIDNTQTLIQQLQEKRGKNDYGFTKDEKDDLIASGEAAKEDFIQLGDKFYYVEGSIEQLIKALGENTKALKDEYYTELDKKINRGQAAKDILPTTIQSRNDEKKELEGYLNGDYIANPYSSAPAGKEGDNLFIDILDRFFSFFDIGRNKTELSTPIDNVDNINIDEEIKEPITTETMDFDSLTTEELLDWLIQLDEAHIDVGIDSRILENWSSIGYTLTSEDIAAITSAAESVWQDIINLEANRTERDKQDAPSAQTYAGKSISYIKEAAISSDVETSEAATKALIARARRTKTLTPLINNLNKAIEDGNDEAIRAAKIELADATAKAELRNIINKLTDETKDYWTALKEQPIGSEQWNYALSQIETLTDTYLGVDLSVVFDENPEKIQEFKQALKDGPDAVTKFFNELNKNHLLYGFETNVEEAEKIFDEVVGDIGDNKDKLQEICTELDGLDFDIDGSVDLTNIFLQLTALGIEAENAITILERLTGKNLELNDIEVITTGSSELGFSEKQKKELEDQGYIQGTDGNFYKLTGDSDRIITTDEDDYGLDSGKQTYQPEADILYNKKQLLLKTQNEINKSESEYNRLLLNENASIDELVASYRKITELKEKEKEQTKELKDLTLQAIHDLEAENSQFFDLLHYDPTTGTLYQDTAGILALKGTDSENGELLEKYRSKMEEYFNQYTEYAQADESLTTELAERNKRTNTVFEKHINEIQHITDLEREQSQYQNKYNRLLKQRVVSAGNLYKAQQEELVVMEDVIKARKEYADKTQQDLYEKVAELIASGNDKYINLDAEAMTVTLNEELVNQLEDSLQESVKSLFDIIKQLVDTAVEAKNSLINAEDSQLDKFAEIRGNVVSAIQKLREAVVAKYQQMIDSMSTVNDSINDSNSKLLDSIQKNISQMRQDRENEKTEQDLRDKEAQLAYLMQDTTGANALKIKELQEQLEEGKESYTDKLIDQKISELQDQNEEAAQQRQEQIDILNKQLELYQSSGLINDELQSLYQTGIDGEGNFVTGSELEKLVKEFLLDQGLTEIETQAQMNELAPLFADLKNYMGDSILGEGNGPAAQMEKNTEEIAGDVEEIKRAVTAADVRDAIRLSVELESVDNYSKEQIAFLDTDGDGKITAADVSELIKRWKSGGKFASGGLADFTGPAWLDGTASSPELVLNAQDTQNFIALKDILSDILTSSTGISAGNGGDNYYEIHIDVEKLESDYDVDDVAERIKTRIREDAMYRNVNIINQW